MAGPSKKQAFNYLVKALNEVDCHSKEFEMLIERRLTKTENYFQELLNQIPLIVDTNDSENNTVPRLLRKRAHQIAEIEENYTIDINKSEDDSIETLNTEKNMSNGRIKRKASIIANDNIRKQLSNCRYKNSRTHLDGNRSVMRNSNKNYTKNSEALTSSSVNFNMDVTKNCSTLTENTITENINMELEREELELKKLSSKHKHDVNANDETIIEKTSIFKFVTPNQILPHDETYILQKKKKILGEKTQEKKKVNFLIVNDEKSPERKKRKKLCRKMPSQQTNLQTANISKSMPQMCTLITANSVTRQLARKSLAKARRISVIKDMKKKEDAVEKNNINFVTTTFVKKSQNITIIKKSKIPTPIYLIQNSFSSSQFFSKNTEVSTSFNIKNTVTSIKSSTPKSVCKFENFKKTVQEEQKISNANDEKQYRKHEQNHKAKSEILEYEKVTLLGKQKETEIKELAYSKYRQFQSKFIQKGEALASYKLDSEPNDETDDESRPKYDIPSWATTFGRQATVEMQMYIPGNAIQKLFNTREYMPNLSEIFHGISERQLARTSSARWKSPPRFSMMQD